MATDVMGVKKSSSKRRWQSSQDEGKKRSSGEDTPRKRRRTKEIESPKSSPSKSPFVTDSDECPTFRTKSFYRSKGNAKFAAINPNMKENTPSPKKKLTPRRTSNRISLRTAKGSESEAENLENGSPIVRKSHLKSLRSSDSDSEPKPVKVLRSTANLIAAKEKEYDFPSVIPFKKGSENNELIKSVSVKLTRNKKNVSKTPQAKKVSDKKFFSTKCPSSAPKSFGSVIVRKGFNLKFVPKRISDQFTEQKSNIKKTPKLAEKLRKLKQREEKRSVARRVSLNSLYDAKIDDIDVKEYVMDKEKSNGIVVKNTMAMKNVSPDSAVMTQMSGESVNHSRTHGTSLRNGSSQLIESSVAGSQELFSDAMSDVSVASIVSGPSERKLRSGITYSPSRRSQSGHLLDSPSRKRFQCASVSKSPITKTPDKRRELSQQSCQSDLNLKLSDESPSSLSQEDEEESGNMSTYSQKLHKDTVPGEKGTPKGRPLFSIFNTPEQRKSLRNLSTSSPSVSSCSPSSSSRVSPKLKKMLKDKDSKNVEQLILDAGQKKFGATVCDVCGMVYTHADPLDETTHAKFHISLINALKFPGWKRERIVQEYLLEGSRVIMVLSDDPGYATKKVADINKIMGQELGFPEQTMSFDSKYKAFLYISENKTVEGCCIAESIQEGYRVIPEQDSSLPPVSDGHGQRPWYCETVPEKADIGISRIWVCKQARQKGIGSRLLDSIRSCFHYGGVIDKTKIAFSDPTSEGKKFATKYTGSPAFLVYKYAR